METVKFVNYDQKNYFVKLMDVLMRAKIFFLNKFDGFTLEDSQKYSTFKPSRPICFLKYQGLVTNLNFNSALAVRIMQKQS